MVKTELFLFHEIVRENGELVGIQDLVMKEGQFVPLPDQVKVEEVRITSEAAEGVIIEAYPVLALQKKEGDKWIDVDSWTAPTDEVAVTRPVYLIVDDPILSLKIGDTINLSDEFWGALVERP